MLTFLVRGDQVVNKVKMHGILHCQLASAGVGSGAYSYC